MHGGFSDEDISYFLYSADDKRLAYFGGFQKDWPISQGDLGDKETFMHENCNGPGPHGWECHVVGCEEKGHFGSNLMLHLTKDHGG